MYALDVGRVESLCADFLVPREALLGIAFVVVLRRGEARGPGALVRAVGVAEVVDELLDGGGQDTRTRAVVADRLEAACALRAAVRIVIVRRFHDMCVCGVGAVCATSAKQIIQIYIYRFVFVRRDERRNVTVMGEKRTDSAAMQKQQKVMSQTPLYQVRLSRMRSVRWKWYARRS